MNALWSSNDLIELLSYLLPGLVASWVFFGLTAYPRPSPFERVVQALILTAVVQFGVVSIRALSFWAGTYWMLGRWTDSSQLVWSFVLALAVGLVFAYLANSDLLHKGLRRVGVTVQTSLPSEWIGAFSQHRTYVILNMKGQRRLYGWPAEWPSDPLAGHFAIAEAEWLDSTDSQKRTPLEEAETILVPASEVELVEFLKVLDEETHDEPQDTKPTT